MTNGPTDLELLEESIAAVAKQKISYVVTLAPPDTVNSPLIVADVNLCVMGNHMI